MASLPSPRAKTRPRLEIIPFIDIMFFLLATFMMVSLSMIQNAGIPVSLPSAATGQPLEQPEAPSHISVSADGSYYFNKDAVNLEQLIGHLQLLKQTRPEPRLFIHGDTQADFGQVVTVLDEARKLGITKIAIETSKLPDSQLNATP
ncbi:MAG: biopolymer transporter ExbD [Blastochloris sp.]|nr:biopolymer transporter ExbD [Blastochloris sp.]